VEITSRFRSCYVVIVRNNFADLVAAIGSSLGAALQLHYCDVLLPFRLSPARSTKTIGHSVGAGILDVVQQWNFSDYLTKGALHASSR
jgi:hypothetical protein